MACALPEIIGRLVIGVRATIGRSVASAVTCPAATADDATKLCKSRGKLLSPRPGFAHPWERGWG